MRITLVTSICSIENIMKLPIPSQCNVYDFFLGTNSSHLRHRKPTVLLTQSKPPGGIFSYGLDQTVVADIAFLFGRHFMAYSKRRSR